MKKKILHACRVMQCLIVVDRHGIVQIIYTTKFVNIFFTQAFLSIFNVNRGKICKIYTKIHKLFTNLDREIRR